MGYLITQIIICLLIAALIGFILGWLLRGLMLENSEINKDSRSSLSNSSAINTFSSSATLSSEEDSDSTESSDMADDFYPEPVTKAPALSHKIEKIEGIGKLLRNKIRKLGIITTKDLLKTCSSESGFQQVIEITKATEETVNQWLSMADLMRVPGIDGHIAKLMLAAGVKSSDMLAQSDPQSLINEMSNTNLGENTPASSTELPDVGKITGMIKAAKTL